MLLPAAAPWGMNCMLPPCDMRPSCSRSCLMDCLMEMGLALSKPPRSLTARNSVTYRLQGQTGIAGQHGVEDKAWSITRSQQARPVCEVCRGQEAGCLPNSTSGNNLSHHTDVTQVHVAHVATTLQQLIPAVHCCHAAGSRLC